MVDTLNTYFGVVADAILSRGGEVLQFVGDAVLAIFECASDEADTRRACEAAFDAAHEALQKTAEKNIERRENMLPPIQFGIGLHVGDVTFGNVGAPTRLGFNVVGPAVNLTARLESLSKQALVPLLVSSEFARHAQRELFPVGTFELRGVREMQEVFTAAELVNAAKRESPRYPLCARSCASASKASQRSEILHGFHKDKGLSIVCELKFNRTWCSRLSTML